MRILNGLAAFVGRIWAKGCLGKAAVILGGLVILGMCGSILGGPRAPAVAVPAAATATPRSTEVDPTKPPPPSPTAVPSATPTIAATETPTQAPAPPAAPKPKATAAPVAPRATQAPAATNFDRNGDGKVTCADFDTQAEAQRALDAGHKNLDGNDKDGRACESLP